MWVASNTISFAVFLQGWHQTQLVVLCCYMGDIKTISSCVFLYGWHRKWLCCVYLRATSTTSSFDAFLKGWHRTPFVLLCFYRGDINKHEFCCVSIGWHQTPLVLKALERIDAKVCVVCFCCLCVLCYVQYVIPAGPYKKKMLHIQH